ncbi:MAG: CTP:molybdopterin cytidylyltransferase [Devosia sp.]|uniref:nucleotidyltransferase family protein n=1 Tax=Devosia sp. TaxID=1871048 RepID=UPI0026036CE8|nr:nucleotidyltransferase family protein [Devosia sp.]MDB5541098.1 CTP:molybdopterin cytidylyltransferase [Devosia sp.]
MTAPETVVAVVLAAGLSRRFGGDKLLHPIAGKALGAHIADTVATIPFASRIAVCPAGNTGRGELFTARGFELIINDDPQLGMGASLALGARRAMALDADAMLVCLADVPHVTSSHLLAVIEALGSGEVAATGSLGTRGPPAIFARSLLGRLAELSGDTGGKNLLQAATLVDAAPEIMRDFDTLDDFRGR